MRGEPRARTRRAANRARYGKQCIDASVSYMRGERGGEGGRGGGRGKGEGDEGRKADDARESVRLGSRAYLYRASIITRGGGEGGGVSERDIGASSRDRIRRYVVCAKLRKSLIARERERDGSTVLSSNKDPLPH